MKKQFKKSLSIFMAVLMLMSCWVFVAPEKAEAVTGGDYPLTIWARIDDAANGCESTVTVEYKPKNGTEAKKTKTYDITNFFAGDTTNKQSKKYEVGNVPGFPIKITVSIKTTSGCANAVSIYLQDIIIGNVTITDIDKDNGTGHHFSWSATTGSGSATYEPGDSWVYSDNWTNPRAENIFIDEDIPDDISVQIPLTGTVNGPNNFKVHAVDQYGVNIDSTLATPSIVTDDLQTGKGDGDKDTDLVKGIGISKTVGDDKDTYSTTVTNLAQRIQTTSYKVKAAVTYNLNGNSDAVYSNEFTLLNPIYTFNFNGNGGTIYKSSFTDRYGTVIGNNIPDSGDKKGYEFIGMYTTAKTDSYSWQKPVAGTTSGYTGQLTTSTKVDGNKQWYAAWWAKNIPVTLTDIDGNVLRTVYGKYGRTLSQTGFSESGGSFNSTSIDSYGTTVPYTTINDGTGAYDRVFSHWIIDKIYIDGEDRSLEYSGVDYKSLRLECDSLVLKPVYKAEGSPNYFVINFYDFDGNPIAGYANAGYTYRQPIAVPAEQDHAKDNVYSYKFLGWTELTEAMQQTHGIAGYIVDEDGVDVDSSRYIVVEDDTALKARYDAKFVPVFERYYNEYTVTYNYDNGKKVVYEGYHWGDPVVNADKPLPVPEGYKESGLQYNFSYWTNKNGEAATPSLNTIDGNKVYNAQYPNPTAATYNIRFFDRNGDLIKGSSYTFNYIVPDPRNDSTIKFEESYKNEELTQQFNFVRWETNDGKPFSGAAIEDADYYPIYDAVPLYSVSYYKDDVLLKEFKGYLPGENLPASGYTINSEELKKDDDFYAVKYKFTGKWADSEGNTSYTTVPQKNLVLYAQYDYELIDYVITFVLNGKEETKTYHYGDRITAPEPETYADETYTYTFRNWDKDVPQLCPGYPDYSETYTAIYGREYNYYTIEWYDENGDLFTSNNVIYNERINAPLTQPVSAKLPTDFNTPEEPNKYDNENFKVVFKEWVLCQEGADGKPVAVDPKNAYVRGDKVTGNAKYMATYEVSANTCDVKFFDENNKELQTVTVHYGTMLSNVSAFNIPTKAPTETEHYKFKGWIANDGSLTEVYFDEDGNFVEGSADYEITTDVAFKAMFASEAHNFDEANLVEYSKTPSFVSEDASQENKNAAKGAGIYACSCGVTETREIPYLVDTAAPGARLYVKNLFWDENAQLGAETIPVAPSSNFIINASDIGSNADGSNKTNNTFDPENKGSGVATIEYSIQHATMNGDAYATIDASSIADSAWVTRFDYVATKAYLYEQAELQSKVDGEINNDILERNMAEANAYLESLKANASGTLAKYAYFGGDENQPIQGGDTFVIFARITDNCGNTFYVHSNVLVYDNSAPQIEVTSEHGDASKNKYCEEVTVSIEDKIIETADTNNGAIEKVVLNTGADEIDITDAILADGSKTVNGAGIYQVIATDAAGNQSTYNFEIIGGHSKTHIRVPATCTADGYEYDRCQFCGLIENNKTIAATGHSFGSALDGEPETWPVYVPATCVKDGYWTRTCSVCGFKETFDDEGTAKSDHDEDLVPSGVRVEATCLKEGYEIKVCPICGLEKTYILPIDKENGHKARRPETKEPTCTEPGHIITTCKYCDETLSDELIDPKGHVAADDWTVITAPTCEEEGVQVKYCKYGCLDSDGNPVVIGEPENVPATGHRWIIDEIVPPNDETGEQGYTKYVCGNDSSHTKIDDLVDPTKYFTLTFVDEDGVTPIKDENGEPVTITVREGESVLLADTPKDKTAKEATDEFTYSFKEWVDAATGEAVSFPIFASADLTLNATYQAFDIFYMITLDKGDGITQQIGYLTKGTTATLPAMEKASDGTYNYEFLGWKLGGTDDSTAAMTYTIGAENVTLYPVYKQVKITYNVTFLDEDGAYITTVTVDVGEEARLPEGTPAPTKVSDDVYQYIFENEWSSDVTNVQSNLVVTAKFTAIEHNYGSGSTVSADCTHPATTIFVCQHSDCGYIRKETAGEPLGHNWSEPVYNKNTGKSIMTCSRCGETMEDERIFTVTFYTDETKTTITKTLSYIRYGQDISNLIPSTATKPETAGEKYSFKNWDRPVETVIKADAEYYGVYEVSEKTYYVAYVIDGNHPLLVIDNVKGGSAIPEYDGETPVREDYTDSYHYVFNGWKCNKNTDVVNDNLYFTAQWKQVAHSYTVSETTATCTVGAGMTYTCSCGYSYVKETGVPLGHNWEVIKRVEATATSQGYEIKKCERCGEETTEILPISAHYYFTVTVTDISTNSAIKGATVTVYKGNSNTLVATSSTGSNGTSAFYVTETGIYTVYVNGDDINTARAEIVITADAAVNTPNFVIAVNADICACTCHKNTFWARIFRFFQKIIKLISPKHKCCANPDARI